MVVSDRITNIPTPHTIREDGLVDYVCEQDPRVLTAPVDEIVGVALRHKDLLLALPRPNRHHNVGFFATCVLGIKPPYGRDEMGFYLKDGTFLNREEAREHALKTGQVTETDHPRELFSEDLW